MPAEERNGVIESAAAGDAPSPGEWLVHGSVVADAAAHGMDEGNPRAERHSEDRTAFGRIHKLRAAFARAVGVVGCMLARAGEVAGLSGDADVAVEVARYADGSVQV